MWTELQLITDPGGTRRRPSPLIQEIKCRRRPLSCDHALTSQPELSDDGSVALDVFPLEIREETAATADHPQEASA